MINQALFNRLGKGYAALYAVGWQELDSQLKYGLRQRVRELRKGLRDNRTDKLQSRLDCYGNNGQWAINELRKLNQQLFHNKKPGQEALGHYVSVEIELIWLDDESENDFIKEIKSKGLRTNITIKDDGTIRPNNDGEKTREIVVTFDSRNPQTLIDVCNALNQAGCYVNKSCGLHVHFDMRHIEHKRSVTTLANRLALCVDSLKLMLPKSRRENQFCRDKINSYKNGSRYAFINLQAYEKHGTLEVRGHSGTTDPVKILNWISILKTIMSVRNTEQVSDIYSLIRRFGFSNELSSYILERFNKFNTSVVTGDDVSDDNAA